MTKLFAFAIIILIASYGCKPATPPTPAPVVVKTVACFNITPANPNNTDNVNFDGSCCQNATKYFWFLDNILVAGYLDHVNFSQSFSSGNHTVKLVVIGNSQSDSITKNFYVDLLGPTACFTISPNNANLRYPVNSTLTFDASCSTNGNFSTATWSIGSIDPTDNGTSVKHTFSSTGTYKVHFSITDGSRTKSNTITKTITIF